MHRGRTGQAKAVGRQRGLRQEDFARILRREEMVELLAESRRAGALAPHAEELARNVLVLRHTPLARVMIPWERVESVDLDRGPAEARAAVARSGFTRLPVRRRKVVVGYLHQLDVLGAPPDADPAGLVRPLVELPADLPLDRAVERLRAAGEGRCEF
jgi:CBS domain containing-hemolysin-like protein